MLRCLKFLTRCITYALLLLVAVIAYSLLVYWQAPVDCLRTTCTYTPIHSTAPRQSGLAADNIIRFDEMPLHLIISLMWAEDRIFLDHRGINPAAIQRAVTRYMDGRPLHGASTISQELVKNVFLSPERSFYRKYVEIIYALKLENHFSKEEILSLYASMAEIAPGVYGLREGAEYYFGQPLETLSIGQVGFLAVVIKAPTWASERVKQCDRVVVDRMWLRGVMENAFYNLRPLDTGVPPIHSYDWIPDDDDANRIRRMVSDMLKDFRVKGCDLRT